MTSPRWGAVRGVAARWCKIRVYSCVVRQEVSPIIHKHNQLSVKDSCNSVASSHAQRQLHTRARTRAHMVVHSFVFLQGRLIFRDFATTFDIHSVKRQRNPQL